MKYPSDIGLRSKYHIDSPILSRSFLRSGEVITPVDDIEEQEETWKENPGKDINLLCLELEALEPV